MPGCWANAASCSASGRVPPWAAQAAAATGAVTGVSFGEVCQQAPAKGVVPGWQPASWPLTVCASTALTALIAVSASTALWAKPATSA